MTNYHPDGLGSIRNLTNSSGQVIVGSSYDAFGTLRTGSATNEFLFAGEQFDAETGLYFLRARYYDPTTGRFITKDPFPGQISRPKSLNGFVYAGNQPVNFIDPFGLDEIDDARALCIAQGLPCDDLSDDMLFELTRGGGTSFLPCDLDAWNVGSPIDKAILVGSWLYGAGRSLFTIGSSGLSGIFQSSSRTLGREITYRSVGAAGARWSKGLMRDTGMTADEAISMFRKATVRGEFPRQFLSSNLDEIERAAKSGDRFAKKALKLLFDQRWNK